MMWVLFEMETTVAASADAACIRKVVPVLPDGATMLFDRKAIQLAVSDIPVSNQQTRMSDVDWAIRSALFLKVNAEYESVMTAAMSEAVWKKTLAPLDLIVATFP